MTATLQVDRIRHLADVIEAQPHTRIDDDHGFNMRFWTHVCGTPACIGGWTNYVRNQQTGETVALGDHFSAAEWLGIHHLGSWNLFAPNSVGPFGLITPAHAAAVLRHLANTGVVDWSVSP